MLLRTMILLPAIFAFSCQNAQTTRISQQTSEETVPVETVSLEADKTMCYTIKERADSDQGVYYDHRFVRIRFADAERVSGALTIANHGEEAFKGSFTGIFREATNKIEAELTLLSDGEKHTESATLTLLENAVAVEYAHQKKGRDTIPGVACDQYAVAYNAYQRMKIAPKINKTDRSRLIRVTEIIGSGLTTQEIADLRFMERAIDLDHNPDTKEYALYVMGSIFCGSGGCNLFIIDDKGRTLSQMSVVKLPVFSVTSSTGATERKKGTWKELFVWSDGFRRLVPKNGTYPSNPSLEPKAMIEEMMAFPEDYEMILDHMD